MIQQNGLLSVLPVDHVLHTMMTEHQILLGYLDQLELLKVQLTKGDAGNQNATLEAVGTIGEHLISAESHHQREEQVLFPAIEKLGIVGPIQAMIQEHEWLRPAKQAIIDMAASTSTANGGNLFENLAAKIGYLSSMLRSHIAREDQVLYPMAYHVIPDLKDWDSLKQACDTIGYCPFTPSE